MATSTSKGFRFHPFDAELIDDFLKPLVVEKQYPCNFIQFRQVYGACSNPWLIFPKDDPSWFSSPHLKQTERCMFVFSKLSKVSISTGKKGGSRKAGKKGGGCVGVGNTKKKAGWGTWDGQTSRKQIRDAEGNLIGEHRYLVFQLNEIESEVIGCDWREVGLYKMHEYSLSGINAGLNSDEPIVLCRITYDSSKKCKVDLKSGSGVDEKAEIDGGVDDPSTATQQLDGLDAINESISLEDLDIWLSFDDFNNPGEDVGPPVDVDQFIECLDFNPQNELVEENSMTNLGKRKSEAEDNSLRNKKTCIF
ncbi:hypothetical protein POM88_051608 [Heracleum sosnowskyi]|uniref:NAC domain-containing protein n=1 Tax=Heracleum sosnowskyi TaxID=360622 RepID=A0AAD8M3M7_9APIA|nr:hypothetical protein POM88_051608 [Heracleum sosnowskyi]